MYGYGIGAICSVICPIQADFYEKCSVWREARVALGSDMSGCSEAAVLRGGFTLQQYGRLCERGFAVGRSGGDAAAHFGGAFLGCFAVREPALEQPDFCGGVLWGRRCLCLPLQIIANFVAC